MFEIAGCVLRAWGGYGLMDCRDGLSGLTLQVTMTENQQELMVFETDNLHVL